MKKTTFRIIVGYLDFPKKPVWGVPVIEPKTEIPMYMGGIDYEEAVEKFIKFLKDTKDIYIHELQAAAVLEMDVDGKYNFKMVGCYRYEDVPDKEVVL